MWEESLALRKRAGGQAYGPFWVLRQGSLALSIKQILFLFFPLILNIFFPVTKITQFALKMKKNKEVRAEGRAPWVGFVAGGAACISHLRLRLSSCFCSHSAPSSAWCTHGVTQQLNDPHKEPFTPGLTGSYPSSSPGSILTSDARVLPRVIFQDQEGEMSSTRGPEDTPSWNVFFFEFQGLWQLNTSV